MQQAPAPSAATSPGLPQRPGPGSSPAPYGTQLPQQYLDPGATQSPGRGVGPFPSAYMYRPQDGAPRGGAQPMVMQSGADANGIAQLFIAQPTGIALPVGADGSISPPVLLGGLQVRPPPPSSRAASGPCYPPRLVPCTCQHFSSMPTCVLLRVTSSRAAAGVRVCAGGQREEAFPLAPMLCFPASPLPPGPWNPSLPPSSPSLLCAHAQSAALSGAFQQQQASAAGSPYQASPHRGGGGGPDDPDLTARAGSFTQGYFNVLYDSGGSGSAQRGHTFTAAQQQGTWGPAGSAATTAAMGATPPGARRRVEFGGQAAGGGEGGGDPYGGGGSGLAPMGAYGDPVDLALQVRCVRGGSQECARCP